MSKNDDLVRRLRERATTLDKLYSHIDAKHMRDAADTIERGAAQGVVTDEIMDAFWHEVTVKPTGAIENLDLGLKAALDLALAAPPAPQATDTRPGAANGSLRGERQATTTPPAPAPDAGEVEGAVRETLREYRQTEVADEDGNGYPLVDALTLRGKGIDMGEREIDNIVSELMYAISPFIAAPSPTPQPPAVEAEVQRYLISYDTRGEIPHPSGDFVHIGDHKAALKAKTDEIERLRRERDEWKNSAFLSDCEAQSGQLEEMTARAEAAEASNKALREGLEPFAKLAEVYTEDAPDNEDADAVVPLIGELRRARALLSETGA